MQVKELMSTEIEVIAPEATLDEAARLMRSSDSGSLPVCDGRRLKGMITDRDIVIRALAKDLEPRMTQVKDVMSEGILYCMEDQEISEVQSLMEQKNVRRLVVLNQDKHLVGIVSIGDLASRGNEALAGHILQSQAEAPAQN